jgi:hypothetical protein
VLRLGKRRLPFTKQSTRLTPVGTVNRLLLVVVVIIIYGIGALLPITELINSCKVAKFI